MPKVSVIIPTHSRPDLFPRAVASAQQAGTDLEIIVVDDASKDDTAQVCRSLAGVRHIRLERNQGVAGARNVGLVASAGEYIAFVDDDDQRLPGSIDRQLAQLEANPEAGFAYGATLFGDRDGNPTDKLFGPPPYPSGDVFWKMLGFDLFGIMPVSVLIRKSCFLKIGLLRRDLVGIDDWDLWVRIAELYPVVSLDEPVGVWREPTPHSNQGTSSYARLLSKVAHHQKYLLQLPRALAAPAAERHAARQELLNRVSDYLIFAAIKWHPEGARRYARDNLMAALRLNPRRAARPKSLQLLLKSLL